MIFERLKIEKDEVETKRQSSAAVTKVGKFSLSHGSRPKLQERKITDLSVEK